MRLLFWLCGCFYLGRLFWAVLWWLFDCFMLLLMLCCLVVLLAVFGAVLVVLSVLCSFGNVIGNECGDLVSTIIQ